MGLPEKTAVITGATGFVGEAVCDAFSSRDWSVVRLGRKLTNIGNDRCWMLGQPIPVDLSSVDCVVHLASATLVANTNIADAEAVDLSGTQLIIDQFRAQARGHGQKFIFVSSQSARQNAVNRYGRIKWRVEQLFTKPNELIIRPGLVFGRNERSSFSHIRALVRRFSILPDLRESPAIQLIHVDDLALAIALIAERNDLQRKLWLLGCAEAMQLKELFIAVARHERIKAPHFITIPIPALRMGAKMIDMILRPVPPLSERVDGLIGLEPFESRPSLNELSLKLRLLS